MVALSTEFPVILDQIIDSWLTSGSPRLPVKSRTCVTASLELLVCDPRLRRPHDRHLRNRLGDAYEFETPMNRGLFDAILKSKFDSLEDDTIARLTIDREAIATLEMSIYENLPSIWLPTIRELGEEEMNNFKIRVPDSWDEVLQFENTSLRGEFRPMVEYQVIPDSEVQLIIPSSKWKPNISFIDEDF